MLKAYFTKYLLHFKTPGGTSRGVLYDKETFFISLHNENIFGIGECGIFRKLSADDVPEYEKKLEWACKNINKGLSYLLLELKDFPSIQFGLEQAFLSLESKNSFELFPSNFTKSKDAIPINGLVWMGDVHYINNQIKEKIQAGFTTIKLKIGALDFETELSILKSIRNNYSNKDIELRVDANGALLPENALEKLKRLSEFQIHSIEQPIKAGQWKEMAELCKETPLPIALDEELIGVFDANEKEELLQRIKPQYIILKPSLVGGFAGSNEWIKLAEKHNIGWWITSALESNIGLNAIAQYTYNLKVKIPQGLGTGSLFTNNIQSPLFVKNGYLNYANNTDWDINHLTDKI